MTTFQLNIPDEVVQALVDAFGPNLDKAAVEALVIEGYRTQKFGTGTVCHILGLKDRFEAETWLGSRGVHMNYSAQDLDEDRATLDRVLGKVA